MRVPFIIYANFECLTEKMDTCHPDPSRAYIKAYQLRQASGFCYRIKYVQGENKVTVVYYGEDAVKHFVECKEKELGEIA